MVCKLQTIVDLELIYLLRKMHLLGKADNYCEKADIWVKNADVHTKLADI